MVKVAFTERNEKKYASKLVEADKEKYTFYCPNPKCRTEMSLAIYENYSNTFKANMKGKEHKEKCWARNSELNQEYSTNDYNTRDFIEKLISSKSNKKNNQSETGSNHKNKHAKLSTLKDIFIYCRTHDVDENIQGEYIRNIFLDDRNMNFFNNVGVYGYKILSPTLIKYHLNDSKKVYKMSFKYGNIPGVLTFKNKSIMKSVLKKLDLYSSRKPKDIRNVIATEWETKKDEDGKLKSIEGKIFNTKQIIDVSSYEI
ncbi:hypothetical protein EUA50_12180 [Staphylococcus saprophyticus]|uniref:hypothetical protein n=1 Tax=Staphylococcus saprophyticus TaxID=29385 RepID=UPI000852B052|nr:hypothetical protein [Staphylococcus saprophyticus]MDW4342546.1 hypothetical protein [Staphylococcus saprophyticus]MDW4386945.1 hypothetical protein [Staphylococcus saprophyticus]MDW4419129.1 hypothetical protein [Staphylococcus saprophyticus]MDW4473540.1 hypothetical protein [Staphylococcus saprophyticus]OEK47266.1 hypothetical protein ASS92_04195 [Staphylococcus saprophyticus]